MHTRVLLRIRFEHNWFLIIFIYNNFKFRLIDDCETAIHNLSTGGLLHYHEYVPYTYSGGISGFPTYFDGREHF